MTLPARSASPPWRQELLDVLTEAVEGGTPGQGTAFLDGTAADGSGNHGLLATLRGLSAEQASQDVNGTSLAGQARHTAFHMEVIVRWERDGDQGPYDWEGSFLPERVGEAEWSELRGRMQAAYDDLLSFLRTPVSLDDPGYAAAAAGALAHVAYHLGAMRQMLKALD